MAAPIKFTPGWQDRLRVDKESLFSIIDLTISVAASRWPEEFKQRRPHLIDQLFDSAGNRKQRPAASSSIAAEQPKGDSNLFSGSRDKEATQKTEPPMKKKIVLQRRDEKTEPGQRHLKKTTTVLQNREEKSKPSSTHGAVEESEKRRIIIINKLQDRCGAEEARKRKIQVIKFQKQSSIIPCCCTCTKKPRN